MTVIIKLMALHFLEARAVFVLPEAQATTREENAHLYPHKEKI